MPIKYDSPLSPELFLLGLFPVLCDLKQDLLMFLATWGQRNKLKTQYQTYCHLIKLLWQPH